MVSAGKDSCECDRYFLFSYIPVLYVEIPFPFQALRLPRDRLSPTVYSFDFILIFKFYSTKQYGIQYKTIQNSILDNYMGELQDTDLQYSYIGLMQSQGVQHIYAVTQSICLVV